MHRQSTGNFFLLVMTLYYRLHGPWCSRDTVDMVWGCLRQHRGRWSSRRKPYDRLALFGHIIRRQRQNRSPWRSDPFSRRDAARRGSTAHGRQISHASRPSGTPLSQIPERAVYAQPFHPFPLPAPAQGYLPSPYAPGTVFYPAMPGDVAGYGPGLGPSMPPAFLTGAPHPPYMLPAATMSAPVPVPVPAPAASADSNAPAGMVAHESNGMVYYYDSSQLPPTTGAPYSASFTGASAGGVVGMGGMMTPPNHFFYPPASNGIYYPAP
jgi:hypothetical protein